MLRLRLSHSPGNLHRRGLSMDARVKPAHDEVPVPFIAAAR
jgi:hypothetical protein